jgi:hypothetical protein
MIESFMPPKNDENSGIFICGSAHFRDEVVGILKDMDYKNYYIY